MVGAFLAGASTDSSWFDQKQIDAMRGHVLLVVMPVFFLSTGLRTNWQMGSAAVFVVAAVLLVASVAGKLIGTHVAGKLLKRQPGEGALIGWLLQTKALIMFIFANVLARQTNHHPRDLHRAGAEGGRQHDADGAGGGADAGADKGNLVPGEVGGFAPGRLGRRRMNPERGPGKPSSLSPIFP